MLLSECDNDEKRYCGSCQLYLPLSYFRQRNLLRTGLDECFPARCQDCQKEYHVARHKAEAAFRKELVVKQGKCGRCNKATECMDFMYTDARSRRYANGAKKPKFSMLTVEEMKREVQHGRFLCLLCHYILTQQANRKRYQWRRKRPVSKRVVKARRYVNNRKLHEFKKCMDCGWEVQPGLEGFLEFDHKPEFVKKRDISTLVNSRYPISTIEHEIAKCDAVCKQCHRVRTNERMKARSPRSQTIFQFQEKLDEIRDFFSLCSSTKCP